MNPTTIESRFGAWRRHFAQGLRQALQWRLLLLWLIALALPLLLATLPLFAALAAQLDRSLLASRLVEGFDPAVLAEALSGLGQRGYAPVASAGGLIVLLALLPWLSGTTVAAARVPQRLGLVELAKGGVHEYGLMLRLWLWALLPLGIALGLGAAIVDAVKDQAQTMILEADAEHLGRAALAVAALLLLFAHATVDAARAQLALEPRRRAAVSAWWRATKQLLRRPSRLLLYAAVTATGLLLAALLGVLRVQVVPVGAAGLLAALLLGQMMVAVLAWMRCARLFALVAAGRQ